MISSAPRPRLLLASFFGEGASWRSAVPLILLALCFTAILLAATSCGGGFDATTTCQTTCDRFASCFDPDYDVGLCTEDCAAEAGGDDAFLSQVATCDACLEDSDCVEGDEFGCDEECAGVI